MVEFDLVIGHVEMANLADMIVATYHLQHHGSGDVSTLRARISCLGGGALREENWARVSEYLALDVVRLVGGKCFKQVRPCVVQSSDLIPYLVLGLCLAIG